MAGRRATPTQTVSGDHASLREDYLNQVQRDCLSRTMRSELRAFNTPSECDEYKPRNRPRGEADYGAACGPTFSKRCNRALLVVYSSGGCGPGRSRAATP